MKKARRTKDKGVTRGSVIKALSVTHSVGSIDDFIRRNKLPMDVSVRTAIKNMLSDGLIKIHNPIRSCYTPVYYKLWRTCTFCGYDEGTHTIYSDAEYKNVIGHACDACYDREIVGAS